MKRTPKATPAVVKAMNGKTAPELKENSKVKLLDAPFSVASHADQYFRAKVRKEKAEADMVVSHDVLSAYAAGVQDEEAYAGRFNSSYAITGDEHRADIIFQSKWAIKNEAEARMILGKQADTLLVTQTATVLRPEVNKLPVKLQELKDLLGDRFYEFFIVDETITVTKDFSELIYNVVDRDSLWRLRAVMKQAKPSIREGK